MNKQLSIFQFYTVEFKSVGHLDLLHIAEQFLEQAEITYFDRSTSTIKVQFVSELEELHVQQLCDSFKLQVESSRDARLIYKISSIAL